MSKASQRKLSKKQKMTPKADSPDLASMQGIVTNPSKIQPQPQVPARPVAHKPMRTQRAARKR